MKMVRKGLKTGDYSVLGLEHVVAVERKSLVDYLGSIASGREAFEAEMLRILAYPCRALVIEATWEQLSGPYERSRMDPQAVIGTTISWMMKGIPVAMVGSRAAGERTVARMLFCAARHRWEEAVSLLPTLRINRAI